jgi:hypothetical protein
MRPIRPSLLWIGNVSNVRDLAQALEAGVTSVVDVACDDELVKIPRTLVFCRFPLADGPGNPAWMLRAAVLSTLEFLRLGSPTMVACSAGMSRSVAVATAALSLLEDRIPDHVIEEIKDIGRPTSLSPGLWRDIKAAISTTGRAGGMRKAL